MRTKLFKAGCRKTKEIYGEFFISGNSLYSMKEIDEKKSITCWLYLKGKTDYLIKFDKFHNSRTIKQEDIKTDPLSKQFIEMIIKDILSANPKLESFKGLFLSTDNKKKIEIENASISFYPGFTTSFIETDNGNYINVVFKNKIIQNETILDYLNNNNYKNNEKLQIEIKKKLIGKSFKVSYAKRNYKIDDILFDRNPKNQVVNYEGETKSLIEYYEIAHKLRIRDQNQPIIVVRRRGPQEQEINLYFIPELCFLAGLDEEVTKDRKLMREINKYCKYIPTDRVNLTDDFIKLFVDPTKDKKSPEKLSAKEKSELYGIEVRPVSNYYFRGYYMKNTKLIGGNKKEVNSNDKTFPVFKKADMSNWLCFYTNYNYNSAKILIDSLTKASKAFDLNISRPELIKMPDKSSAKDWIDIADHYIGKEKKNYNFILFLLGKNDDIYSQLKKHSLYNNNYVSQVVKVKTLKRFGILSVCSKILLQINNKLGGKSYILSIDKHISERKLMIIGVDSSHIENKRTGVAMVATINDSFDEYYNKEEIIEEEKKQQLCFCISSFIRQAIIVYFKKNKEYPRGMIIYRQGVSLQEKEYLKSEIIPIDEVCKSHKISYYYILVNKKENYKFFVKRWKEYLNPESELLVTRWNK